MFSVCPFRVNKGVKSSVNGTVVYFSDSSRLFKEMQGTYNLTFCLL